MKKRNRKLWKALLYQQILTFELIAVVKAGYDADSAEDSAPGTPHPAPSIHKSIEPIKGDDLLRSYR